MAAGGEVVACEEMQSRSSSRTTECKVLWYWKQVNKSQAEFVVGFLLLESSELCGEVFCRSLPCAPRNKCHLLQQISNSQQMRQFLSSTKLWSRYWRSWALPLAGEGILKNSSSWAQGAWNRCPCAWARPGEGWNPAGLNAWPSKGALFSLLIFTAVVLFNPSIFSQKRD